MHNKTREGASAPSFLLGGTMKYLLIIGLTAALFVNFLGGETRKTELQTIENEEASVQNEGVLNQSPEETVVSSVSSNQVDTQLPSGDGEKDFQRYHQMAMQRFLAIQDIPGAKTLVQDIKMELEDNPNAFNLSDITEGEDHILREDYLERMIPNPELREKWTELMRLILEHAPQEG